MEWKDLPPPLDLSEPKPSRNDGIDSVPIAAEMPKPQVKKGCHINVLNLEEVCEESKTRLNVTRDKVFLRRTEEY